MTLVRISGDSWWDSTIKVSGFSTIPRTLDKLESGSTTKASASRLRSPEQRPLMSNTLASSVFKEADELFSGLADFERLDELSVSEVWVGSARKIQTCFSLKYP